MTHNFSGRSGLSGSAARRVIILAVLLTCATIQVLAAQERDRIPVRALKITATSDSALLHNASGVRALRNGSIIVNDASQLRLVVLDSTLMLSKTIADTSAGGRFSYGLASKPSALVAWRADSSLFADSDGSAILVIDPSGDVASIIAAVKITDLVNIGSGAYGYPSVDARGRLLYGTKRPFDPYSKLPTVGGPPINVSFPDSLPIVRADFDLRSIDTVAMLKAPRQRAVLVRSPSGAVSLNMVANPFQSGDDWTTLDDGTIAIVRAADYHIDFIAADGSVRSSPSLPFASRYISVTEKQQIVDSIKRVLIDVRKSNGAGGDLSSISTPNTGFPIDTSDIPESYPPIRHNHTLADFDGRVWVLPSTTEFAESGLVYDVVSREGKLLERVRLPMGRSLVGFGTKSQIYLSNLIGPNRILLERAEIVR